MTFGIDEILAIPTRCVWSTNHLFGISWPALYSFGVIYHPSFIAYGNYKPFISGVLSLGGPRPCLDAASGSAPRPTRADMQRFCDTLP